MDNIIPLRPQDQAALDQERRVQERLRQDVQDVFTSIQDIKKAWEEGSVQLVDHGPHQCGTRLRFAEKDSGTTLEIMLFVPETTEG